MQPILRTLTIPAALALAALPAPLAAAPRPPAAASTPPRGTITLYQSDNRVLTMMRIGDGELVPMVFDTGSDGNSVDRLLAERHRFRRIGDTIELDGTTGKRRMLPSVRVPRVSLGGVDVGAIDAVVLDYDRNDAMGIVTSELFTGSLVHVELSRNRARVTPKDATTLPAGPATPYVEGIITVQMEMPDGSRLPAHFDTGYNAALSLPVSMMKTLPLHAPAQVVGRFKSINTEGEVWGGRVKGTIRIGPLTLVDPEVSFLGTLANIGLPIIRRLTLVLDPAEKRGWILPAPPAPKD